MIIERLLSKQLVITLTPFKMWADHLFIISIEKNGSDICINRIYVRMLLSHWISTI